MSTHITTPPALGSAPTAAAVAQPVPARTWQRFKKLMAPLASLRLTVVLFLLSMVLVFCGTVAQKDFGVWTVVNHYFRSLYVWIPFRIFFPVAFLTKHPIAGGFPFPGGWLIGGLLLVNLLAAHLVRFKLSWKRSGILILHAGLVLMMVGELVTGLFADEGHMDIVTGSSSNYIYDLRKSELAIIDPSDRKTDDVVVVPQKLLQQGTIHHEDLPFDIEVQQYMANSVFAPADAALKQSAGVDRSLIGLLARQGVLIEKAPEGTVNPATAGLGLSVVAVPRPEVSGAETGQQADFPSAYLTFRRKDSGEVVGTYLVSSLFGYFEIEQPVKLGEKSYNVTLRFKRTYKPYTVNLLEFRHDLYEGTEIPKNFSSQVHLVDASAGEQRDALIKMNEPLRYHGETLYQSGVLTADSGTSLQVVRNPGWLLPYFSCALVALGMLAHFGITLNGFLRKQLASPLPALAAAVPVDAGKAPRPVAAAGRGGHGIAKGHARGHMAAAARTLAGHSGQLAAPAASTTLDGFARFFPWIVVAMGLVYFIVAMVPRADAPETMHLEEFAGLPVLHNGRVKPMDTVARVGLAKVSGREAYKFTVVDKDGKEQPEKVSGPPVQWLLDLMTVSRKNPTGVRAEVIRIDSDQVLSFLGLPGREGLRYSLVELGDKLQKIKEAAKQADRVEESQRDAFQVKIIELAHKVDYTLDLLQMAEPRTIPPQTEGNPWRTWPEANAAMRELGSRDRAAVLYDQMLTAYARGNTAGFNKALEDYRTEVDRRMPEAASKSGFEQFFNHFAPFYQCAILYTMAFLLCCISWLGWRRPLARAAFGLALLTLVVHTWALVGRMYISGRPPVTNLYSSAIFIGWVGAILCLGVEAIFRNGFGTLVATFGGAVTMLIAHLLASGDTMEMLQAVLDTNFWLATHVVCVTIGYATTYVAGVMGMIYIVAGVVSAWKPDMDKGLFRVLGQMIYGVVCFAMFFSFVGTVLGGIWADQSWGRFWGWDPKENGALLIVIWNALILHARWAGLVRSRGLAVLAVAGNIITSWSWFGTNMLGIGLHSYGFTPGTLIGMLGAIALFLTFMGVGMRLPQRAWRT